MDRLQSKWFLLLVVLTGCGTETDSPAPDVSGRVLSSGVTPSPVALPVIPAFEVLVTAFGAVPDDGADDTAAIQLGLDFVSAVGGGTLVFPPGRFDISINPLTRRALTLHPRLRLAGRPAGAAALRLADNQILYESIMATASYPTRLDDAEFVGLTFDANGLNNPVRSADETNGDLGNPTLRYVLRTYAGDRVRVQDCAFVNLDNGNTLSFNGQAVQDIVVERSRFLAVGGALIDHDHSTLYIDARHVRIVNNEFRGRNGAGTLGARTAIETHGDDIEVLGNTIHGYLQGANIVGMSTAPSSQLYADNVLNGVAVGLNIWSLGSPYFSDPRPAFGALLLARNEIQIDADAWWASPAMVVDAPAGIRFEPSVSNAGILLLAILENRVSFETFSGRGADQEARSVGIGLRGVEGRLALNALDLSRNTVRNAPGPGILSTANVGGTEPSRLEGNTLIDCGRGSSLVGEGDALRTGVVIGGTTRNLTLTGNTVTAGASPVTTRYGFVLASTCLGACVVAANATSGLQQDVIIAGSGWTGAGP